MTQIRQQLLHSWWVIFFALLCLICYEQGMKSRNAAYYNLMKQMTDLRLEKVSALAQHADLTAQLESQTDVNWIELVLMRELGVIPEGQRKVFFKD